MNLKPDNYKPRLIDKKIDDLLQVCGAVSIEGQNGVVKHLLLLIMQHQQ